jgi:hypothetical protein
VKVLGLPAKNQKSKKGVRVMDLGPSHERMNNMLFENGKVLAFTVAFRRL